MAISAPNRRQFLACLAASLLSPVDSNAAAAERADNKGRPRRGVADTSASPHVVMRNVDLANVTWSKGFWADRFETCRESMIPHLSRIMDSIEHSQFLHNFRIAAGMADGRHRGPAFNDGDCYTTAIATNGWKPWHTPFYRRIYGTAVSRLSPSFILKTQCSSPD
jgi:hypothetical protein